MSGFSNRGRVGELCAKGGRCSWRNVGYGVLSKARFRKCTKCGNWQWVANRAQMNLPNFRESLNIDIDKLKSEGVLE